MSIAEGHYNLKIKFIKPLYSEGKMYLETGAIIKQMENKRVVTDIIEIKNVFLTKMDCDLIPFYATKGRRIFPFWVELEKLD